ncbi:hypothetical protein IHE45_14G080000 [Dioscorea alata]|uniref:Uncharacterized protein n=1 Tax=Dioscorea alata TaxID=55571 RepID=A0ACB7USR4_DIOAL|nr:hypothetical protein IHE45_14G080000 [Dioscorea alata]
MEPSQPPRLASSLQPSSPSRAGPHLHLSDPHHGRARSLIKPLPRTLEAAASLIMRSNPLLLSSAPPLITSVSSSYEPHAGEDLDPNLCNPRLDEASPPKI